MSGTPAEAPDYALVLSGGGARGAYQAGVLRYISEAFPEANFSIMVGVSAGAINTAHLSNHVGTFAKSVEALLECWHEITPDQVYESASSIQYVWSRLRRTGSKPPEEPELSEEAAHGLVDTAPLRDFLERKLRTTEGRLAGVVENLHTNRLKAAAIVTTNYATGQTVTWVQGREIGSWERPSRVGINTALTIEHIMASTALPLLFPAIRIGDSWYGDGGIRLSAPLAPAVHLGADRILAISTRYGRTRIEADQPVIAGYPPMAQVVGLLMNAIFLDALDQDAHMMERVNQLLLKLPRRKWGDLRPIRLLLLRPSRDLGKLASQYELELHGVLRLVSKQMGSRETKSPDWLSMLLFESRYIEQIIDIGYQDARRKHSQLAAFLADDPAYRQESAGSAEGQNEEERAR